MVPTGYLIFFAEALLCMGLVTCVAVEGRLFSTAFLFEVDLRTKSSYFIEMSDLTAAED